MLFALFARKLLFFILHRYGSTQLEATNIFHSNFNNLQRRHKHFSELSLFLIKGDIILKIGKSGPIFLKICVSYKRDITVFHPFFIVLLAILKKSLDPTTFVDILKNFLMCTMAIEALTPLDRTWRINMYKNIARSRLF